ncbi:acyl-CoA synthetase (AMP-forming)/AMP-acid ligase II [Lentzea flaviverrucosa]|uniref:Acyl-CoA synthetase (AMP-forming)/AMP-acid ligase II n=2 Tax=Lentzea flaviverrucosa TaxID=200379 RepID=A0A1H9XWS4_9PSEU|nr:acyl-CoA synthetase (AMP-forming)/AMP-acid ligase II [Lentzea flaviverrucosa]SES50554.1 Acyl-CoA synthetase (AMP-forming)/AMP-acid ligase II [Lentzea flaviverrucosa]
MKPHDMGTLFEQCSGAATIVRLDRPFDIAPSGGDTYTVAQLAELVLDAAGWLSEAGVRPGDRVAVVKRNHWDYDLLACAVVRLGAVPALLSGHLPGDTLETLVKRLDPALVVTDGEVSAPRVLRIDEFTASRPPSPHRRRDDDPLIINHTSGTTGVPKLVVHTTRTIIDRLARPESVRWPVIGTRRDDVMGNASSYAHGRTFCWTASALCLAPREIVLLSDASSAARVFGAHPPTVLEALPSAYVRWRPLAAGPDNPFHAVRRFVSTYDAMHPPVIRTMLHASRRRRPLWMQGWGQTETGPLSFRFLTRSTAHTTRDLGRPMPGMARLRVVDPQTLDPVPRGTAGLVFARTRARCAGYVGEQDRWDAKADGPWWNTGDLGVVSRTGVVTLLDREVDTVAGLSCLAVEDTVEDRLPDVQECVLLAASGKKPIPVVVTDTELDLVEWRLAVADLPPLAEPVVLRWDDVPRTGTGKVRRLELLARLVGAAETNGSGRWT